MEGSRTQAQVLFQPATKEGSLSETHPTRLGRCLKVNNHWATPTPGPARLDRLIVLERQKKFPMSSDMIWSPNNDYIQPWASGTKKRNGPARDGIERRGPPWVQQPLYVECPAGGRRRMRPCGLVSITTKTQWIHSHMLRRHTATTTDDETYGPADPLWRLTHVAASWVASTGVFTSRAVGFRSDGKRGSA